MKPTYTTLESISIDAMRKYLIGKNTDLNYELEFVRRITCKSENTIVRLARRFFLCDFSYPFLEYIAQKICHLDSVNEIQGEYFEFISKEDYQTSTPYYKLTLYDGTKNATLQTYVSVITVRYFRATMEMENKCRSRICSIKADDQVSDDSLDEGVIENEWYHALIYQEDEKEKNEILLDALQKSMELLPEREQLILKLMVMGDASCLDAFEELEPYITPTAKTPTKQWTTKQKQDAMSLLKARALSHLKKIMTHETYY